MLTLAHSANFLDLHQAIIGLENHFSVFLRVTVLHAFYCTLKFACRKFSYATFQKDDNKGVDQTARTRRLICAFVVRMQQNEGFSRRGPQNASYTLCICGCG